MKLETEISVKNSNLLKIAVETKEAIENTNNKGQNLDKDLRDGVKSLKKRSKDGELVITETDKSGKFCVFSMEEYMKAGEVHTRNDEKIDEKELKKVQNTLNATCSMFLKVFRVGENSDHVERHRTNHINQSVNPSAMRLTLKDHKGLENIKTRPLCGPGMNTNLSNLLSDILEAIANNMPQTWEQCSTESVLGKVDKHNKLVDEGLATENCREILEELVDGIWGVSKVELEVED